MCSHAWTPFVSVAVTAGAAKAHPMMVSRITGTETSTRKSPHREADVIRGTISI
jgi:hypothetical protein